MRRKFDSIGCPCGACQSVGNLAIEGEKPIVFAGGQWKGKYMKTTTDPFDFEYKKRCLWCGKEWPEKVKQFLSRCVPAPKETSDE